MEFFGNLIHELWAEWLIFVHELDIQLWIHACLTDGWQRFFYFLERSGMFLVCIAAHDKGHFAAGLIAVNVVKDLSQAVGIVDQYHESTLYQVIEAALEVAVYERNTSGGYEQRAEYNVGIDNAEDDGKGGCEVNDEVGKVVGVKFNIAQDTSGSGEEGKDSEDYWPHDMYASDRCD